MYSLGYNSFWSFGSPAVQELLTRNDLKLDELLEEDGLVLEVKNHNQNLYDFILQEDNFKQLISYAITVPDVEKLGNNQKKCFKYPFTCADILSSDSQRIVSEFFKSNKELQENAQKEEPAHEDDDEVNVDSESLDKDNTTTGESQTAGEEKESPAANEFPYLDFLFGFYDSDALNLTSAGYFAKIVNNLLNKKPTEFLNVTKLLSYIYERKPELLQKMIKHIGSKSIAEFLAKVLTFESSVLANVNNEVYNDKRSEVLKQIVKKLQPESDIEEINNTAYLICEVFGKYNTMHCSHEILHNLLERQIIDYFFGILKTGKSTSCCAVALILGNIFAYYILVNTPKPHETNMDDMGEGHSTGHHPLELSEEIPLIAAFIENLDDIVKFIGSSSGDNIPGQYGSKAVPFGSARLKVLELIIIAMKANNKRIYSKLIECNFFETLLDIFVKHDWNNMLHNQVEKILSHVIEGNSEELKAALFERARILDFIINASKDTDFTLSGKHSRKVRKGYLGQLIRLSNKITESKHPLIVHQTQNNENWKEYTEAQLAEANRRDKINFGGRDPRTGAGDDDIPSDHGYYSNSSHLNTGGRNREEERDEEDKKEEEEEEIEEEEVDNQEEEDEDKQHEYQSGLATSDEFLNETEKHVLEGNPIEEEEEITKEATVPIKGRNSFGHTNKRIIPDYDEEVKEENENIYLLDAASLKTVEEKLDPKYHSNQFWKKDELFSADDILKEVEGL